MTTTTEAPEVVEVTEESLPLTTAATHTNTIIVDIADNFENETTTQPQPLTTVTTQPPPVPETTAPPTTPEQTTTEDLDAVLAEIASIGKSRKEYMIEKRKKLPDNPLDKDNPFISEKENQKTETNLHRLSIDLPLSSLRDVSLVCYKCSSMFYSDVDLLLKRRAFS